MKYSKEELQQMAQKALQFRGQPGRWETLLLKLALLFPRLDLRQIDTRIQDMARGEKVE